MLSRLRLAQGDFGGAATALREALPIAEKAGAYLTDSYSVYYAYTQKLSGDSAGAHGTVEGIQSRLPQTRSNQDRAHKAEGLVAYAGGKYTEAVAHLMKIFEPNWKSFDTRYVLARSRLHLGQSEAAAEEFRDLLEDYSDIRRLTNAIWAVDAYFYLASAEEQSGDLDRAIEHYEMFIGIWSEADLSSDLIQEAQERLARLKTGS